jgi:peroxiredoxin Q/BCP
MPIEVGKKAPPFSLQDQSGKSRSLDEFRGRWLVLYFYPKDDTPGCTVEACEFTSQLPDFGGLDAAVVGVSPDAPADHVEFRRKHDLGIDLLSDPDKKVLRSYDAWGAKAMHGNRYEGVLRSTVLIDPQGVVAHHWQGVRAQGHAAVVRAKLAELRAAPR